MSHHYCEGCGQRVPEEPPSPFTPEYVSAMERRADVWVRANGGHETVLTYRSGRRLLYCFNFHLGKHAYLDMDRDRILTDEEALLAIGSR